MEEDKNKDKTHKRKFEPYYNFCLCHGYTRFNKKTNKCMKCAAFERKMKKKFYPDN